MIECYPFAAIAGQERAKRALLYNLIEPAIGGVLLCGEKGTAKSTMVRALAELTDQQLVELPLNITEDMLVGTIDFERAVREGVRAFSGGVLERSDGNILYVDEVNLLPDSIVSTLICTAASGSNVVEREGISYRHSSRFILVGSMNPEEGKLRGQFLDRFGLYTEVTGEQDVATRAEIIRRWLDYERNPAAFRARWREQTQALRTRILRARTIARGICPDESVRSLAAQYARQAGAEGNRCELVLVRTAAAAAAWAGRDYIAPDDMREAAFYVLPHRRRETSPEQSQQDFSPENQNRQDKTPESSQRDEQSTSENNPPDLQEREGYDGEEREIPPPQTIPSDGAAPEEQLVEGTDISLLSVLPATPRDRVFRQGSGRRSKTRSGTNRGRCVSFTQTPSPKQHDLALDATLRAAAPYQCFRSHADCAVAIRESDLRYKVRENHVGATIVFVVDASGSMGARSRMKAAKEAVLSMLLDSYQKRDRIGLVAFRKQGAQTLLDITASVDLAQKRLQDLPTGGRTPLAAGLYQAWQLLRARRLKDPEMLPMVVLVTDGRANCPLWTLAPVEDAIRAAGLLRQDGIRAIVVDTEKDFVSLHIARQIAQAMEADYYKVDQLRGEQLRTIVKGSTPPEMPDSKGACK